MIMLMVMSADEALDSTAGTHLCQEVQEGVKMCWQPKEQLKEKFEACQKFNENY